MVQMWMGGPNKAALSRVAVLLRCRKKYQFPFLSCARKRRPPVLQSILLGDGTDGMGAVVKKSFCRHHTGRGGKGLRMGAILDGKKRFRLAGILRRSGDGPRTGLVHSIAHVFTEREPGG